MLRVPSEQEIKQYIPQNGNVFHKILEDIEELPEPSVLTVSRLVKKLYLISSVLQFMAGNVDKGAIERAAIKDGISGLNTGSVLSGTQEYKDKLNQVKDGIRTYATSHCEALTKRLSAPIEEAQPQEPIIQGEPPQGIAPLLMQHTAIFSPPPRTPLVLPEPEKFYQDALNLAYGCCEKGTVDFFAALKTANNIEVITSILDLMVLRTQGSMEDETEYEDNIQLLLARLSEANAQPEQPTLHTQTHTTHWIMPFTILIFSLAIIPIIASIFKDITPESQAGLQP